MICILLLSTLQALHGWQCDWVFLEETEFHIRVYVCVVNVIVVVVYGTNINLSEYYTVPCRTYIYMYTDVGSPLSVLPFPESHITRKLLVYVRFDVPKPYNDCRANKFAFVMVN